MIDIFYKTNLINHDFLRLFHTFFIRLFVGYSFGHLKPPDCSLLLMLSIIPQILRKRHGGLSRLA